MPDENAKQRMARHIAGACLAGALGGVVVARTQSPTSPRLAGDAPSPAARLSLWYRAPASDHPLLTVGASREARQAAAAEWVRALPLGNGRLGAMVFGGIVHERLQLNEDTLWAGRPYDPVNPDAKDALPEVRRLLVERSYREAARLVDAKVMSKPLAQMPYQTVGDLALTFPEVHSVENYRRELDLATATAHVSYTSGGVTFSRELFASAPDQVIVVRLTASRPGCISFETRMETPQRATVEAAAGGDLVMRGVNGDGAGTTADGRPMSGALQFEARVRVLPTGGTRRASGNVVVVRNADAVTLLIAAATSYRTYEDVGADPAARVAAALDPASRKGVDALRASHLRDYRQLFDRVTLELGPSQNAPTDERVRSVRRRRGSRSRRALLPVRPLPADCQLTDGFAAGKPSGPLEREHVAAVGQQVHHQHQHRDELLAGALDQPGRDDGSIDGDGVGSLGHVARERRARCTAPADGWRITTPISGARPDRSTERNGGCGRPAARG